jgi:hypothetical protein
MRTNDPMATHAIAELHRNERLASKEWIYNTRVQYKTAAKGRIPKIFCIGPLGMKDLL